MKHNTTRPLFALLACALVALAACGERSKHSRGGDKSQSVAAVSELHWMTVASLVDEVAHGVSSGHKNAVARLESIVEGAATAQTQNEILLGRLGFLEVLDDIRSVDGNQVYNFEAEALIRELYRRGELAEPGQGQRVLALLYQDAAREYPAVADDKIYEPLRRIIAESPSGFIDPASLRFVSAAEAAGTNVILPEPINRALGELTHIYTNGDLGSFSQIFRSVYGPPPEFSDYLARNDTLRNALADAIRSHGPPPSPKAGVMGLMRRVAAASPAASDAPSFRSTLLALEPELGFRQAEDAVHLNLASMQDELPSRIRQMSQAARVELPGTISKGTTDSILRALADLPDRNIMPAGRGISLGASAQQFSNYISTTFGDRGGGAGGSGALSGANPSSGQPSVSRGRIYTTTPAPERYLANLDRAIQPVSRSFSVAVRSSRAARGVAVGAPFRSPGDISITNAAWVANNQDDRFGRIVLEVSSGGSASIVATRTLFADSVMAALDVLWGGHSGVTEHRDSEILVLMSMDPFDIVDPVKHAQYNELYRRLQAQLRRLENSRANSEELKSELLATGRRLDVLNAEMPRRVVFHPALWGRELAWSTCRVDFAFNDVEGLSEEASRANGGTPMPPNLRTLSVKPATTWQFYQREGEIVIENGKDNFRHLRVRSAGAGMQPSYRGHFAVTLFEVTADLPEGREIGAAQRRIQPMLDWLAVNHHDFIRLDDFAEAFTILRWVRSERVSPLILDLDGPAEPIATPDRIIISNGPMVR